MLQSMVRHLESSLNKVEDEVKYGVLGIRLTVM
jgi:hypothetical protein